MPTKLCKWGNSMGVRLPQYVVERTGLRPGDYLFIRLTDAGDIVIQPVKQRDAHPAYAARTTFKIAQQCPTPEEVAEKW